MSLWSTIAKLNPFSRRKSRGERQFRELLSPWLNSFLPSVWATNRAELVNHNRGWPHLAIKAIAEEICGMAPQVAYVVRDMPERKAKAWKLKSPAKRARYLRSLTKRLLPRHLRIKSLAHLQVQDELEPVDRDHRLLRLLRNPNGPDVAWTFFYRAIFYLQLVGGFYVWVVPGNDGLPAELWILPPHWVRPIPGEERLIDAYEIRPMTGYSVGTDGIGWFAGGVGVKRLDADDVIQIGYPHLSNYLDFYGTLSAVGEWVDVSENIDHSRVAHFVNGMFPGVYLEIDKEIVDPDKAELTRMMETIKQKYGGTGKTKEPILLAPGIKMVPITASPEEMDYGTSAEQMQKWLCAAYRVTPSKLGMTDQQTYANLVAGDAAFHGSTIKPILTLLGQTLTEKLAKRFDDDLVVFWPDSVPMDPAQRLAERVAKYDRGVMTANEWRTEDGDEAYEYGGGDPVLPMGVAPIPWATGTPVEELPVTSAELENYAPAEPSPDKPSEDKPEEVKPVNRLASALGRSTNGNGKHE